MRKKTVVLLMAVTAEATEEAFSGCTSVTEITVGSGLKEIGSQGFYNCGSLTALVLPSGFTTMGERVHL